MSIMKIYEIYFLDSFGNVENVITTRCPSISSAIRKASLNRGYSVKAVIQSLYFDDPDIVRETVKVCNYV